MSFDLERRIAKITQASPNPRPTEKKQTTKVITSITHPCLFLTKLKIEPDCVSSRLLLALLIVAIPNENMDTIPTNIRQIVIKGLPHTKIYNAVPKPVRKKYIKMDNSNPDEKRSE